MGQTVGWSENLVDLTEPYAGQDKGRGGDWLEEQDEEYTDQSVHKDTADWFEEHPGETVHWYEE